jgi:hypothetical protein
MLRGGSKIVGKKSIKTDTSDATGKVVSGGQQPASAIKLETDMYLTVAVSGAEDPVISIPQMIKFKYVYNTREYDITINVNPRNWSLEKSTSNSKTWICKKETIIFATASIDGKGVNDAIQLKGTSNIKQEEQVLINTYTSSYKLEEIDNLREYILKQGKKEVLIKANSAEEWIGTSFIKDVLVGTASAGTNEPKIKMPIIQMEMGGLCLKTLQSDIFNNWVNKEWVDGDNGIKAITDVAITDGKLNLDSLNIAQKVYNMLNRIAVSGGSYKDWIETVYTTDYYFRAETPVYEGGMSTIIDFEAVVSNSASTASGVEEPLGSLAGRGYNGQKKGGKIKIKVNEPCYIMGIASITPLVDYSQGNDWDNWLETMDDLHKPQLDGIGYQDLMENKMHGLAKPTLAIGKQPAWLDYMTNFNKTFADFAAGEQESYMVLNRIYNVDDKGSITNATTYINPKDYTYIFATNTETNRDFWVQIGCGVTARRASAGAEVQPAQAFQPMGIQMALQAQQVMANTQLANAEADKTRAEATAQNMQNLIGNSIDLAQKIGEIGRTKQEKKNLEVTYNKTVNEVKKVQEEVNNLMLQGDILKENKELLEFRNEANRIIKNGIHYDTKGNSTDWHQAVLMKYFGPIGKEMAQWDKDEQQALFDKGVLERLMKDIDAIATGKANEFSLAGMKFDLMQKQWERESFELEQDQAASKLLDKLTGEGEYARLLGKFLKLLLRGKK